MALLLPVSSARRFKKMCGETALAAAGTGLGNFAEKELSQRISLPYGC